MTCGSLSWILYHSNPLVVKVDADYGVRKEAKTQLMYFFFKEFKWLKTHWNIRSAENFSFLFFPPLNTFLFPYGPYGRYQVADSCLRRYFFMKSWQSLSSYTICLFNDFFLVQDSFKTILMKKLGGILNISILIVVAVQIYWIDLLLLWQLLSDK